MLSFRTLRQYLGPAWLTTNGDSALVGYSLDIIKDCFVERTRLGLLVRFPQQDSSGTLAPPDAIVAMGADRRVVKGINETDASYVARLITWLDDRQRTGNAFALMQKLSEYTGPGCVIRTVDNSGNWYTRNADGTTSFLLNANNWDWDGNAAKWSRCWVIIYPPASLWVAEDTWGADLWGDTTGSFGSTALTDQVQTIRGIVADWKPAGTREVNTIIALDPASFPPSATRDASGMPDGNWLHWSKNVAGTQVPSRLSTARFWDGTS